MSQPVEGGASPECIQVVEIEDQMRNQERILAQLHESIIEQDKQLMGREAEAQSYASKLENLKTKHSRDHMGQEEAIPGPSVRGPMTSKGGTPKSSGSLTLLRQKVEENRVKVAQRGRQELESKRELEEKVQALKSQLEEMQRVPVAPTTPDQVPVDTQMIALQEQIQAKDSLIEARTRAITLLSEDFSRKRKEVVDQLEETREEMRHMQNKFITCEDYYKAEIQTRDNRLFELDSKVRALSIKLEQTEETSVLAENEYLQRQDEKLNTIEDEKQCLEDECKELLYLLDVHQQKEVKISAMLEEKQRLHDRNLEELAKLSEGNRLKEEELSLLLDENQKLQHKVDKLTNLSDVYQQKEDELAIHIKKNQSLQKRVDKLSRLLAANDKKAKEMSSIINNNQQREQELSNLSKEKQCLENKVQELSLLLDASQQRERAVSLEKTIILVGANSQQADEMAILLKEKQSLKTQLESLTGFLGNIRQESDPLSPLQSDKLDELIDLIRLLYVNDQKVGDLQCILDTTQNEEIGSALINEKLQLEQKLKQCSALLDIYRETVKSICTQRQESGNLKSQALEEQTVGENLNTAQMEELSKLIDISKQHKEEQELLTKAFDALELRVKEQSQLLTNFQSKEEELLNNLCDYEKKCKELTIALENKEPLQEKVDELSKVLDSNQHKHKEDMLVIEQEKQLLQERVQELSNIIEANDQNIQAINEHVSAITQEHRQELTTSFQEKRSLQDEVQELANVLQAKKQDMQGIQDCLDASQQQYNMEVSVLLNEKQLLQVKVDELSGVITNNNKCLQEMEEALRASQKQHNENLAAVLEKTHLLDAKVEDYSQLLKEKEVLQAKVKKMVNIIETNKAILEKMNDNVSASEKQHHEALSELNQETQYLQDKVQELLTTIEKKDKFLELLGERLHNLEQQNAELANTFMENRVLKDNMTQLYAVIDSHEENLQRLNDNLSASEEQHYEALSDMNKEKQCLVNKVQELLDVIELNDTNLQEMNCNLRTSDDLNSSALAELNLQKQILEDKVQELSNTIEHNEYHVGEMNNLLTEHIQRVEELSNMLEIANQDIANQKEEIEHLIQERQRMLCDDSIHREEKQSLIDNIDKLSNLLNDSQKEHVEEVGKILEEKTNLETEVLRLADLMEETTDKHKLSLHKAHMTIDRLRTHADSLKKADDSSALILDLQNRIAELEEEKGNLQLHLVDFDEFKALGVDLAAQVETLRAEKVSAEMKSVELEEEIDNMKNQAGYVEDPASAIKSLTGQLQDHLRDYDELYDKYTCYTRELADKSTQVEKLFNAQYQLEETCSIQREEIEANETKLQFLNKRQKTERAAFCKLVETSLHVVHTVDKFCSDILSGQIRGEEGVLEMEEIIQVAIVDGIYSMELQELNANLGELTPMIFLARISLLNKEALLGELQTKLSEASTRTVDLEIRLQQLECCENESVRLKKEVDSLKHHAASNQMILRGSDDGIESFGDSDVEAGQHVASTLSHLQEHTPGNSVNTTQVYESRIKELEQDKLKLAEELKSAQVRSGKLIKKIKSLKTEYDSLVDKNLKLHQDANSTEMKNKIDFLEKEVATLQSELSKRDRKMEEASTQADDDQLTWLSNEYESVKLEIQHLIEEIHSKDAYLVEVTRELQSKRGQWDELLEEASRLRETISARDGEVARLEELLVQHRSDKGDSSTAATLLLLRQKEDEVARLEGLLRQPEGGERDTDPPHRQLDESLYMLHQKEVRCDELTLELMQLLEERDTLQLRLSTTIRQYEELRASCAHEDNKCTSTLSPTPNDSPVLSNKLQEVRSMGREQRSMALQQRADATVSRDNQSQSETLINWIRGRTTPKVLHI